MKRIYRCCNDLEVVTTATQVKCPHCEEEWSEQDKDECGGLYIIECEECGKKFEMYFDA